MSEIETSKEPIDQTFSFGDVALKPNRDGLRVVITGLNEEENFQVASFLYIFNEEPGAEIIGGVSAESLDGFQKTNDKPWSTEKIAQAMLRRFGPNYLADHPATLAETIRELEIHAQHPPVTLRKV